LFIQIAQLRQLPYEIDDTLAQERLAARNPDLLDSCAGEEPNDAQIDGKRQVTLNRTLITGATVDTFVVAAVRDRNSKVGNRAAKLVP
jgi:hypothetical protein